MGLYTRNGTVFNAAVVAWADQLGNAVVSQVTSNVINRLRIRNTWNAWQHIGRADDIVALAALDCRLFGVTSDNRLWRRFPVGADVPWKHIGHADDVSTMAASGNKLFCITADNALWSRDASETDMAWQPCGSGTPGGTRAIAAAGGLLYAIDNAGRLQTRAASTMTLSWREVNPANPIPSDATINTMTSYSDILFATTTDNRLLRTDWDFIWEATGWMQIMHANFVTGIACINGMLFAATRENKLWWLDIRGLRLP
jgi:hypothetical protein